MDSHDIFEKETFPTNHSIVIQQKCHWGQKEVGDLSKLLPIVVHGRDKWPQIHNVLKIRGAACRCQPTTSNFWRPKTIGRMVRSLKLNKVPFYGYCLQGQKFLDLVIWEILYVHTEEDVFQELETLGISVVKVHRLRSVAKTFLLAFVIILCPTQMPTAPFRSSFLGKKTRTKQPCFTILSLYGFQLYP